VLQVEDGLMKPASDPRKGGKPSGIKWLSLWMRKRR
jgi:hypothetical protein